MNIAAILERKGSAVVSVTSGTPVREAVALLAERRIGALPVADDGAVLGIFSERDVIYCLESAGAAALDKKVADVMSAPAITITRDTPILAGLAEMSRRRIRHLPVVEENRLAGIVSIGDLVQYRLEQVEREAEALRSYIQSS
jgi:CBS domain-containing protein